MAYPKGAKKPPTSGRKKGTPNKVTGDIIETLKSLGHDPAAIQVHLYNEAMKGYYKRLKLKNEWGATGMLHAAIQANGDLMKYVYPTRKAVDHNHSGQVFHTYTDMVKALTGDTEVERDVTGDGSEEST